MILHRIDDITSLDPAETFEFADLGASRNMYQKLVNFDLLNLAAGYQPEVAESWTASEDGRSITFRIRECLRFHSGHPVTAEDAEFSLRRAVILNLPPSFILTQFGFRADSAGQTVRADGKNVTITIDKPYLTSFVLRGDHPDHGWAGVSRARGAAAESGMGSGDLGGPCFILDRWWVATMPGLAISAVPLAFNLLGDGLRDILDPRDGGR